MHTFARTGELRRHVAKCTVLSQLCSSQVKVDFIPNQHPFSPLALWVHPSRPSVEGEVAPWTSPWATERQTISCTQSPVQDKQGEGCMSLFLAFVFRTVAHAAISAANKHFSLFELSLRKCLLTDTCEFLTVFDDVIPPLLRCYF